MSNEQVPAVAVIVAPAQVELGVDHLTAVLVTLGKLGMHGAVVLADGRVGILDFPELVRAAGTAQGAMALQWLLAFKEAGEVDSGEKETVKADFAKEFNLPNDQVEALVEEGLAIAVDQASLVHRLSAFGGKVKQYVSPLEASVSE